MGRRRSAFAGDKPKKRKKVTVKLIPRVHAGEVTEPYRIMEEIRAKDHGHLDGLKISLAWRMGWRPDANGIMCLGKCRKRGDLDRELDTFDFVILLNKEAWQTLNEMQKWALIDHELCHAQVVMDADGNPKQDDCGRFVCRVRKHDVEEFKSVVDRHGLYTQDLAAIALAAVNDAKRPLLPQEGEQQGSGEAESKDGESKDGESTADAGEKKKDWKSLPISEAIKNQSLAQKLIEADLTTIGKLSDHMAEKGDWWVNEIKGVGKAAAEKIADMMADFWADHPEYCD